MLILALLWLYVTTYFLTAVLMHGFFHLEYKYERVNMKVFEEINKLGISEGDYINCLKTIVEKKNGDNDYDWQEIVSMYNLPIAPDTLRKSQAIAFGGASVYEYMRDQETKEKEQTVEEAKRSFGESVSINKDGSTTSARLIEMDETQQKDPHCVLKLHGFDPERWDIVSAKNNLRQTGKHSLYASYLTVRPKKEDEWSFDRIERFYKKLDREYSSPVTNDTKQVRESILKSRTGGKMLLINIADLHMNLQSSMLSAGNEYNCDIAEALFFRVLGDIIARTSIYDFDKIIFCIGGDMLNGDGLSGCTSKGTQQDSDIHYYDAYERLCSMTIKAIDMLKNSSPIIDVIYVPGNHDEATGFKLAMFVDAWFRNDDGVHVDYSPLPRKYTVYGKTLLCFAHDGDAKKLPALIADEARQYWSYVNTTEVFLQHLHSEQILMEDNNIRIQRMPTISAKSKWANDNGFNSKRQCKSFVFDEDDGLTDVIYTNIKGAER